jgi:hypothetical protein
MPSGDFGPESILEVLHRHQVRFVLIGGLAAVLHGSPFPTEDVDITPQRSSENLDRLATALTELNARVRTEAHPKGQEFQLTAVSLLAATNWNLVTDHGSLDLVFMPDGTTGYPDLARDAEDVEIRDVTIAVSALADIIRSKQTANRLKDQRVLPTLREILAARRSR